VIEALAADVAGEHGPDDGLENDDASS
jgi:hypothetical protein